jgi:hypothetical protein
MNDPMKKALALCFALGLMLTLQSCHKTPDNDGLQAHELRALDLFERMQNEDAQKQDK